MSQDAPLSVRFSGEKGFYSLERDLAHNFDSMFSQVSGFLLGGGGPFVSARKYIKANQIAREDLSKALEAYRKFIVASNQYYTEGPDDVAVRVGWAAIPQQIQFLILAVMGYVMTGAYFYCVRSATLGPFDPVDGYGRMMEKTDKDLALLARKNRS